MRVGFTGTRHGLTLPQRNALYALLRDLRPVSEFHHGDCVGADEEAHHAAYHVRAHVVLHPPVNVGLRAYCQGAHVVRTSRPYMDRNKRIVDETDLLIACPVELTEQERGGTWKTFRYALSQGKPVRLVLPDGRIVDYNGGKSEQTRAGDAGTRRV